MAFTFTSVRSLLLENLNQRQSLVKNGLWLGVSDCAGKLLRAFLLILVARAVGAAEYGKFSFALSFISLFVSFLDLGLSAIITREFAGNRRPENDFKALVTLKFFLGLATCALIAGLSLVVTAEPQMRLVILLLAVFSFLSQFPEIFFALFRAMQKMEYEAIATVFSVVMLVGVVSGILGKFHGIAAISWGYLTASVISTGTIALFFSRKIVRLELSFEPRVWRSFLAMSWPLAFTSMFSMLYNYTDSVMMGLFRYDLQNGWYNAALKIIYFGLAPAGIISQVFFPVLSRHADDRAAFQRLWNYQVGLAVLLATPFIAGGVLLAPGIVTLVYGTEFLPAANVLKILLFMGGLSMLSGSFCNALIVRKKQEKMFLVTVLGACLNICLNLVLIPRFNFYGAAAASVISYGGVLFLYVRMTRRYSQLTPFNRQVAAFAAIALCSACLMTVILRLPGISSLPVVPAMTIAAFSYVGSAAYLIRKFQLF